MEDFSAEILSQLLLGSLATPVGIIEYRRILLVGDDWAVLVVHIRIGVVTGRASLAADLGLLHDVIDWRILAKEIAGIGL